MMVQQWKLNQTIAGCIITMGGFAFGCGISWTATALPSLNETEQVGAGPLSAVQKSWIASLLAVGALLACPMTGLCINDIGRKTSLFGFSGVGLVGWFLLACATDPIYIYFGRLLTGISVGGYTVIVPVYVSEIASKANRGFLGSFFVVMLCMGKLYTNGIGIYFSASTMSLFCAFHPVVYAAALLLIPESPKFLARKGCFKEAHDSLKWFEATGVNVPFTDIRRHCEIIQLFYKEKNTPIGKVTVKDIVTSRELLQPMLIVFMQMLLAQFCGINVSTFYTVDIFRFSGDTLIDSKHATLILAAIQTIGCIPCGVFVDTYGRRVLSVSSFITMSLAMLGLASFFYMKVNTTVLEMCPLFGLVPIISLIIYNLAYSWGVGSVVWIIMSELLPSKISGPASAISNILYWGGAFFVTTTFEMFINTTASLYPCFLFFSLVCLLGSIFNIIFLPETKGLSPQEIQSLYKQKEKSSCSC